MLKRRAVLSSMLTAAVAGSLPARLPARRAPFKLFDAHAHFYSSDIEKYPLRADVASAARDKVLARPVTPETLFKMWDDAGVEMGCGVQYNTTYATDNRYLLDVGANFPRRILPIVILSPTDAATPATLSRMAKQNHISGVRFAGPPDTAGNFPFLSDAAKLTWQAANDLGLVIVLMPIQSHLPEAMGRVAEFAIAYPNVRIVLDHIGFPKPEVSPTFGLSPQHLALAQHKNIYFKYTTYLINLLEKGKVPIKEFLRYVVATYGDDHILWGSDVGNTEGRYEDFVTVALESADGLPLAKQRAIFYDTAKSLFIPGRRG